MDDIFKFYNDIDWRTYETFYALDVFKAFWMEGERLIVNEAELNELLAKPERMPSTPEERAEHSEEMRAVRHLHDEVLSPTFRYSAVVMLFATFEREYRRFADNLAKEVNSPVGYGDLKGGLIDQVSKYTLAFKGFSPAAAPTYERVRDLQKVRDCIVHCYGDAALSRDRAHLVRLESLKRGIEVLEGYPLHVEPRFIVDVFEAVYSFFKTLFDKVGWKINDKWLARD
jgi:hypothetical protein